MKTCTKCGIEKPLSEFHKNMRFGSGYSAKCIVCVNSYRAIQRAQYKIKNADGVITKKEKKCYTCGEVKASSKFYKNITTKDGLCSQCITCARISDSNMRKKYIFLNKSKNTKQPVLKKCFRCNEFKSSEYFYTNNTKKDGLSADCKPCFSEYDKQLRKKRKENHLKNGLPKKQKHCNVCGETKPIEFFQLQAGSADGVFYCCKSCKNLKNKKQLVQHTCDYCNKIFYTAYDVQKYCPDGCADKAWRYDPSNKDYAKKSIERLDDRYIVSILASQCKTSAGIIRQYPSLIEATREHISLKRTIKSLTN